MEVYAPVHPVSGSEQRRPGPLHGPGVPAARPAGGYFPA